MKNIGKSKLVGTLILAILALVSFAPRTVLAAVNPSDIAGATFTFNDGGNIVGDFGQSGSVMFTDVNSSDSTRNYLPAKDNFCDPGDSPDQNGVSGNIKFGINIDKSIGLTENPIPAQVKLGYIQGTQCTAVLFQTNVKNPGAAAATDFTWNGADITSLDGSKSQKTFTKAVNIDKPLYLSGSDNSCKADGAILLDNPGGNSGTYYLLTGAIRAAGGLANLKDYPALNNTGALDPSNCHVISAQKVTIAGTQQAGDGSGSGGTAAGNNNDDGQACFQNSGGSPLTWFLCPVLDAASGLSNALVGMFEDQLSFRVADLGSVSSPSSGAFKMHKAWSMIRIISSTLVVVVLLVMVIAEALGVGPFDAYTIRKLLPKLVIAVIVMQVSWDVFAYAVNVVDDIGRGLASIMYAPFNGASQLDLWHLLANAKLSSGLLFTLNWAGIVGLGFLGVAYPFTMAGVALMAILSLLAGLMTLVFRKIIIIMALIISPLALLAWVVPGLDRYWKMWKDNFTKALVMFPLIVLIIASGRIFAYVTGTQDNGQFLNLIFILCGYFLPLFILPKAYQWGGVAMNMAGKNIAAASKKIGERPKKLLDTRQQELNHQKAISAAERLAAWEQGRMGPPGRLTRAKLGSIIRGDKFKSGEWDPTYRMPPGIARDEMRRQREEKMAKFRAAAPNAFREEVDNEFTKLSQAVSVMSEGDRRTHYRAIIARNDMHREGELQAALKQALQDRDYAIVENWINDQATSTGEDRADRVASINRFRSLNAGDLGTLVPHLLKGDLDIDGYHLGIDRAAGSSQQEVALFHGRTVESILSHLSNYAVNGGAEQLAAAQASGDQETVDRIMQKRANARRTLDGFLRTYAAATENPNVRGNVNRTGAEVIRRFLDENTAVGAYGEREGAVEDYGRERIETGPNPNERSRVLGDQDMQPAVRALSNNIQPGGVISDSAAGVPAAAGAVGLGGVATGPVTVNIPHEALANAVAEGARRGVASAFSEGAINLRPQGSDTASPGGVILPENSSEARRINEARLNTERQIADELHESNEDRENNHGSDEGGGEGHE